MISYLGCGLKSRENLLVGNSFWNLPDWVSEIVVTVTSVIRLNWQIRE